MPTLGYVLFGLSVFYLFFAWQFPYEQAKKAIIQGMEESVPVHLTMDRVEPAFPWGLRLRGLRVQAAPIGFTLPDLTLRPEPFSLFAGKINFILEDGESGRRLRAEIHLNRGRNQLRLKLDHCEMTVAFEKAAAFPLKLSGETTLRWAGEDWNKWNGPAWALLEREGKAANAALPLPFGLIENLRAEMELQNGVWQVKRVSFSGKDLQGEWPGGGQGIGGPIDWPALWQQLRK